MTGLRWTPANRVLVSLVVLSLFLERFERAEEAGEYALLPVPDLFFSLAIVALASKALIDYRAGRLQLRPVHGRDLCVAAFALTLVAVSGVAVLTEPEAITRSTQVVKTSAHLLFLAFSALVLAFTLSREWVRYALDVFIVAAVVSAAIAVLQAIDLNVLHTGTAERVGLLSRQTGTFTRPQALFSEPAYLGYACLLAIVLSLVLRSSVLGRFQLPGLALCLLAFLLAAAAGPVVVAVPILIYVLLAARVRLTRATWLAAGALVVVVMVATPAGDLLTDRASLIGSGDDASGELRVELNRGSVDIWRLAPVTGVGLGNTRYHLSNYVDVSFSPEGSQYFFNSANAYFNLLGETGPVGVVALVLLLGVLFWPMAGVPPRLELAGRTLILFAALAFLLLNPLLLPWVWVWAGLRLAMQGEGFPRPASGSGAGHFAD